jgi:hypothetical protein
MPEPADDRGDNSPGGAHLEQKGHYRGAVTRLRSGGYLEKMAGRAEPTVRRMLG